MNFHYRLPLTPFSSLLLALLMLSGCATEKALTEQTKPLQVQIAAIADRQSALEKQMNGLQSDVQALSHRADLSEKNLTSQGATNQQINQQLDALKASDEAVKSNAAALTDRVTKTELDVKNQTSAFADTADKSNTLHQQSAQQIDALIAKQQEQATVAASQASAETNLSNRIDKVEENLKSLSSLVQEAMAQSAKEIFLANGKEAFTVTLTDDKVLYPQNDPQVDAIDAAKLDELAKKLDTIGKEYHLDIQGHTDNFSSDDNNYNLGKARAEVMKRYLHEKCGISFNRMSTISYGANKPLHADNHNNRRIFIRVLVLK